MKLFVRVFIVFIFLCVSSASFAVGKNKVFVLAYHTFFGDKKFDTDISIQDLESQVNFFIKNGFKFVSAEDIDAGLVSGSKNILVTIDDGSITVMKAYNEVLLPHKIKPVLAIYPNIISKKATALTWTQLGQLSNAGCTIASHGFFHLFVNQKLREKNVNYFNKEIFGSKKTLEEKIGVKISIFIYPFGVRSDITKKTLREAGYKYAYTINWGSTSLPLDTNKDPFDLRRYMIAKSSWKTLSNEIVRNAKK